MPERNLGRVEIKKVNRSRIYRLLYEKGPLPKQAISLELQMSLPTVSQNLKELGDLGLLEDRGALPSEVGRRARAIGCAEGARLAIGLELTRHHVSMAAVNLRGRVLDSRRFRLRYAREDAYYQELGRLTAEFAAGLPVPEERILGVGIAVQGLVTPDGQSISYGKILDSTGETLEHIGQAIPFPCVLCHDAAAAAFAELWISPEVESAFYLSLSNHLGGAYVENHRIFAGMNNRAGRIEHTTVSPQGRPCYCGQQGCLEAYCAAHLLAGSAGGSLEDFFTLLAEGGREQAALWEEYLDYLAIAVNNIRMLFDCDVILGGHVGEYLTKGHLEALRRRVSARSSFETGAGYLRACRFRSFPIPAGAALQYVEAFLREI